MYLTIGLIINILALYLYSVEGCSDEYSCCPPEVSKLDCSSGCLRKLDVLFILESGGQLSGFDWTIEKQFLNDIKDEITQSTSDGLQFALVTFAATAMVNFNFDLDTDDVEDAINDAPQIGGAGVNYQIGMDTAANLVLGSQHDRPDAANACIFITSTPHIGSTSDLKKGAANLHTGCDRVLVIGISNKIDLAQLSIIAPNSSDQFSVNDFIEIVDIVSDMKSVCADPGPTPPSPNSVVHISFGCLRKLDVLFILESGGQLSGFDWTIEKQFLNDIKDEITQSTSDRLQFALVTFAATAMVNFNFDLDTDDVEDAINDAPHIGGAGVNYKIGMDIAANMVLGSQHDRPDAANACIFITSTPHSGSTADLKAGAENLQAGCDRVLVIGISNKIDLAQISIVTPNSSDQFSVNDFNEIVDIVSDMKNVCADPGPAPPSPNSVVHICPIFPDGDDMQRIGKDLADCALMMCEAEGELSDNKIPAVIKDNLRELRKCIRKMIQLMIDGRDIMSSSLSHKKKIKKLKAWLKNVKKQKAAIKKNVKALLDELTMKQKKKAINKFNTEMKRLCKKIEALIKTLSDLLT